jgi:hypothetical protein
MRQSASREHFTVMRLNVIDAFLKEQSARRWMRIRKVAPVVGRIALFTNSLFEWVLSPDGPAFERAMVDFDSHRFVSP